MIIQLKIQALLQSVLLMKVQTTIVCLNPSLSKCAPDESGNCPEDFNMNEDGQCFPKHAGCPDGYHSVDDDETGRCIPDSDGCPEGMIFRSDGKTCGYKDNVCEDKSRS